MNPAACFVRPRPVDNPTLRLIGFHHAGGSAAVYHSLIHQLPPDWDLLLLDLPGRGKRYAQTPVEDMSELVAHAVRDVRPWLDSPGRRDRGPVGPMAGVGGHGQAFALFGHSLGAILAAEVGRALQVTGMPPTWVGVSGRVPPGTPAARGGLHELGDADLLAELSAMGGMPDRLGEVPEFRALFLRIVRADLRAVDSYRPDPGRTPLTCPLTVFGGSADAWAPPEAMAGWSRDTYGNFRERYFPGGHFYFLGSAFAGFARALVAEITDLAGQVGAADRIPHRRSASTSPYVNDRLPGRPLPVRQALPPAQIR